MKLQTAARELFRETERDKRTTTVPSLLTCRWEQDPRTGRGPSTTPICAGGLCPGSQRNQARFVILAVRRERLCAPI